MNLFEQNVLKQSMMILNDVFHDEMQILLNGNSFNPYHFLSFLELKAKSFENCLAIGQKTR
jgi:hypothetical protein